MKILIVEDDLGGRTLLSRYLKGRGELHLAEDGEVALRFFTEQLIAGQPFDLVLLDIMLPLLNGQEVLAKIRALEFEHGISGLDGTKVLMLTALRDAETIIKSFRLQCEGYLTKPIHKEDLFREIANLGLSLNNAP